MTDEEKITMRSRLGGMSPDDLFDAYDLAMRDMDRASTGAEMLSAAQAIAIIKVEMIRRMKK